MSRAAHASAWAIASLALLPACDGCGASPGDAPPAASASAGGSGERPPAERALSFIDALPTCSVDHRGAAIDLGTEMLIGRTGWAPDLPPHLSSVEHGGATWTTVPSRDLDVDLHLLEPSPVFVSARIRARAAKSVAVSLDGAPLGTLRLTPGEARIVTTPTTTLPLDPGRHRISLRFSPAARDDVYADVDWLRLGRPDDIEATFGAPTLADLVVPAASLGKVPHRSLVLRPPAAVRCALRVPPEGRVRTSVGMLGEGRAEAEIRVLEDGTEPRSLARREVISDPAAGWLELEASLDAFAGRLVTLEIGAPAGATTGRLAFGEPEVVAPARASAPTPKARGVLVVVLAGVETADLPPYRAASEPALDGFSELSRRGTTFLGHRAPSTLDAANLATLLTGLEPDVHGQADAGARLPATATTLLERAQQAQVRTAFVTGVPSSFSPFGLAQGAGEVIELSPVSGDDATTVVSTAATWLERVLAEDPKRRALAIVHARGGHPPWTPTAKQLEVVAPTDYAGDLQPRRAAQQIAQIRGRRRPTVQEPDRVRMRALHTLAVAQHDAVLGEAVRALEAAQLLSDTLVVVTADVSSSVDQLFSPDLPLTERALQLPLWVLFPGDRLAGKTVRVSTEIADVAATLHAALGLPSPAGTRGADLFAIATRGAPPDDRPALASMGNRFSARWGELVLSGTVGKPPALCHLDLDPTCAFDRRPVLPLATSAMFRELAAERARRGQPLAREAVVLDDATKAALTVWGR